MPFLSRLGAEAAGRDLAGNASHFMAGNCPEGCAGTVTSPQGGESIMFAEI